MDAAIGVLVVLAYGTGAAWYAVDKIRCGERGALWPLFAVTIAALLWASGCAGGSLQLKSSMGVSSDGYTKPVEQRAEEGIENAKLHIAKALPPTTAPQVVANLKEAANSPTLVRVFDEFAETDALAVSRLPISPRPHGGSLAIVAQVRRDDASLIGSPAIFAVFTHVGSWVYLKCHHVAAVADGQRLQFESEHDGTVMDGGVSERISFEVPLEGLRALAQADDSRIKICNDVYSVEPRAKWEMMRFVAETGGAAEEQPASQPSEPSPAAAPSSPAEPAEPAEAPQ